MKRASKPARSHAAKTTTKRTAPARTRRAADKETPARPADGPDPAPAPAIRRDDAREPADLARDQRLRDDLQEDGGRSPADRHRERLTAIEAEEDDAPEGEDDEDDASAMRTQALDEQAADDEDDLRA